jgi:predicted ATPase
MKMQIKSLRAIACGPLRDVTIDFTTNGEPRPITLLAGANGSGKTSVLELIVSLAKFIPVQPIYDPRPNTLPATYSKASYARLGLDVGDQRFAVEFGRRPDDEDAPTEVVRIMHNTFIHNVATVGYVEPPPDFASFSSISMTVTTDLEGAIPGLVRRAISSQGSTPFERARANCQIGSIIYVSHQREIVDYRGTEVHREETKYSFIRRYLSPVGYEGSLDSYLIWLEYSEPAEYERTIHFLNGLDFDGKTFGVSRKELKATVTTRDGHTHGLSELSSGEQNILEILLGLHRYLLPNSIVLIDEIENSLHPAFQYKMGEALKKLQQEIPFQLIVTSHAPAFLEIFGPENTLLLTEF